MAERSGPISECPPCGAEAIIPLWEAFVVGNWKPAPAGNGEGASASPVLPSEVFSTRRPRDAIAGAASGLKTATRSFAIGVAALACCPLDGARKGGTAGALRGLGEGLATAMVLPFAGALVAAAQTARGVANTPEALAESLKGFVWNHKERCWAVPSYSLAEEARQVQDQRAASADAGRTAGGGGSSSSRAAAGRGARRGHSRHVDRGPTVQRHDRDYYELLRVQPTASCTELRRAYYRESRRCHPDKVGADPRSVAHFQQLSEAYKVLRSPELRHAYDLGGGEEVTRQSATVDLGALYAAALGGARWEPHLGRLALARILAKDFEEEASDDAGWEIFSSLWWAGDEARDPCQVEREVRCAVALAERLRPAVAGDLPGFERAAREEARRLAEVPFAPGLLHAMALVYESEAAQFLGAFGMLDLWREAEEAKAQGRVLARQASAMAAGVRAVLVLRSLLEEAAPQGSAPSCREEQPRATAICLERPAVQAQLPLLAQALWRLTLLDVEGTLRRACRRVLRDGAAELAARVERAEAMQLLAEIFREAADARAGAAAAGAPGEDGRLLCDHVRETAARLAAGHGAEEEASEEASPERARGARGEA